MSRLGRKLIFGGIAPKYVSRTLPELSTHFREIKEQCIRDGTSDSEAESLASETIGSEEAILEEALAKPELKSLTWRYQKVVFLFGPTLIYLASFGLFLLFLYTTFSLFRS